MADCRKCKYFKPLHTLRGKEYIDALETARLRTRKTGVYHAPLGYCTRFKRGITYFSGKCKGYEPLKPSKLERLTRWLKVKVSFS